MPAGDIHATRIALVGAAIGGTVVLVVATVLLWLHGAGVAPGGERLPLPYDRRTPEAALQSAPQIDLQRYRADKQRLLDSMGWVDREAGIVRIPIETAMALRAAGAASAIGTERAADASHAAGAASATGAGR